MNAPADVYTCCSDVRAYPDVTLEESTGPQLTALPDIWPGTSSYVVVMPPQARNTQPFAETGNGEISMSATRYNQALIDNDQPTMASTRHNLALLLEEFAYLGDHQSFAALVETTDWANHGPDELTKAIDSALSLEMASLAIKLAQLGGRLFSGHERVQQAAQVLAPPVVHAVRLPRARRITDSMAWFQEHAGQYRGQWVAVREGRLLGAAAALKDLMPLVGDGDEAVSTIVTRVL